MTRPDVHLLEKAKAANSSYTAAAMEMRRQTLCLTNSLNYTHTRVPKYVWIWAKGKDLKENPEFNALWSSWAAEMWTHLRSW